jgi:putative Ca2+/H+ antiporter (TMEM165/GDT1 family)
MSQKGLKNVQAVFDSILIVALAEMGDKTQLLSLMLVLRYKKPWAIMAGVFIATVANHMVATLVGALVAAKVPSLYLHYAISLMFIGFGLWLLKPDSEEGLEKNIGTHSAFVAAMIAFFIAEMGDKTQLVTVALAARHQSVLLVTLGSSIGMVLANALSIFGGERLIKLIPMKYVRYGSCLIFVIFGILALPH